MQDEKLSTKRLELVLTAAARDDATSDYVIISSSAGCYTERSCLVDVHDLKDQLNYVYASTDLALVNSLMLLERL